MGWVECVNWWEKRVWSWPCPHRLQLFLDINWLYNQVVISYLLTECQGPHTSYLWATSKVTYICELPGQWQSAKVPTLHICELPVKCQIVKVPTLHICELQAKWQSAKVHTLHICELPTKVSECQGPHTSYLWATSKVTVVPRSTNFIFVSYQQSDRVPRP
jgi:hypothetical protein